MRDAVDTFKYRGYEINIVQDLNPEDPRSWDNLGRMLCAHKRYSLGDPLERAAPYWSQNWTTNYRGWGDIEEAIEELPDA